MARRSAKALRLSALLAMPAGAMPTGRHMKTTWSAIAAEAAGRYDEALAYFQDAERGWQEFGDPYELAHTLLGQGRCLSGLERTRPSRR